MRLRRVRCVALHKLGARRDIWWSEWSACSGCVCSSRVESAKRAGCVFGSIEIEKKNPTSPCALASVYSRLPSEYMR